MSPACQAQQAHAQAMRAKLAAQAQASAGLQAGALGFGAPTGMVLPGGVQGPAAIAEIMMGGACIPLATLMYHGMLV